MPVNNLYNFYRRPASDVVADSGIGAVNWQARSKDDPISAGPRHTSMKATAAPSRVTTVCLPQRWHLWPLSDNQREAMQANGGETLSTIGSFSVSIENTTTFIMGLGSWARSIFDALPIYSKGRVLSGVAKTDLDLVKGINRVVAKRQSDNSGDQQELAPVLPHQL